MMSALMPNRIHILGASGSGTTTLGKALAQTLDYRHFDTDDYFWLSTDPPFQHERDRAERQALLDADLGRHEGWVLSGSLCGWGDVFIPSFDLVVFLWVPQEIRLARLRERERARYGDEAIAPGGPLYEESNQFLTWAAAYDDGVPEMRSWKLHEEWLRGIPCPVLRHMGAEPTETQHGEIIKTLES
jgi:adenylate kinase family enzyme